MQAGLRELPSIHNPTEFWEWATKQRPRPPENVEQSKDDGYWGIKRPRRIEIASNSMRKALMAHWLLESMRGEKEIGLIFPVTLARELPQWFMSNVANGDNVLPPDTELFLGYYHGVEVWAVSTNGESSRNTDPIAEAGLKVQHRVEMLYCQHNEGRFPVGIKEYIVTLGSDTVEVSDPNEADNKLIHHKGKPRKESDFPVKKDEKLLQRFWKKYVQKVYKPKSKVIHTTGMYGSVVNPHGQTPHGEDAFTIEYNVPKNLDDLIPFLDPDAGGGGLLQQIMLHKSREFQEYTVEKQFVYICAIMGMPLQAILRLAESLSVQVERKITI